MKKLTSFQVIIFGFLLVILTGALLLMLPWATRDCEGASFADALFTAVSAVCVTGLVVQDTALYWSEIGQAIILILIQIGGMGVITIAVSVAIVSGRKIGLMQRSTMQEAISAPQVGGIVRLTGFVLKTTFVIELLGAGFMYPIFAEQFGAKKGMWYAVFHSVSAFCNAGFDLMGVRAAYSSLTSFAVDPVINIVVITLIILGGIGFLTWNDIAAKKWRIHSYRMQSKVILLVTFLLILFPTIYFYFCEFAHLPVKERLLYSVFQAVTPRTAGFNTADLTKYSETGTALTIVLMLIGGSPGSTAGGIKTTTVAVLVLTVIAVFNRREDAQIFSRRIQPDAIRNAAAILLMYLVLFLTGGMIISRVEGISLLTSLFETASAIGTVGLTLGITSGLGMVSRTILIFLMFFGRVGGLTIIYATLAGKRHYSSRYPKEKITVG